LTSQPFIEVFISDQESERQCVYGIFVDYDSVCTILLLYFGNISYGRVIFD